MRIALIAPPWYPVPPTAYGGIETVVDCLARGYTALGHEVVLFATGDSTCPVPRRGPFAAARSDDLGDALVELRHVVDAYNAAAEFDVVHDHTTLGALASPIIGPPIVVTAHGIFDECSSAAFTAISRRARVVAISAAQGSTAPVGVIDRVVHNGIDVESIPIGSGDGGHLAFLGRMSPSKGLLEAIAIARTVGIPLRIAAKVREPAEVDFLESAVRPMLGDGIEFLGEIDAAAKYELLGGARALLSPIRWLEPFGLVMVEALATGTPVLTTGLGAATEIVEHGRTGFIGCDADLVAAIDRLGSIDRADCRRAAVERFSLRRMAAEYVRMFVDLVDGTARRSSAMDADVDRRRTFEDLDAVVVGAQRQASGSEMESVDPQRGPFGQSGCEGDESLGNARVDAQQ